MPSSAPHLRAVTLNCTLKKGTDPSSTDVLLGQLTEHLEASDVEVDGPIRIAELSILPGVSVDEGPGDDWPDVRRRILDADLLVLGTPIWMGQPSSVAKRVLERLDAELSEEDDDGRMRTFDKVAIVAIVGNEDGAHHVAAEVFQALNDVGFTIPAIGSTYWVGEAMGKVDYRDLDETPEAVAQQNAALVRGAVHLARVLEGAPYPAG